MPVGILLFNVENWKIILKSQKIAPNSDIDILHILYGLFSSKSVRFPFSSHFEVNIGCVVELNIISSAIAVIFFSC